MFNLYHFSADVTERIGSYCAREEGYFKTYLFIFFYSAVKIKVKEKTILCPPGTAILYEPNAPQYWISDENRVLHSFFDFSCEDAEYFNRIHLKLNTPLIPRMTGKISAALKTIQDEFSNERFLKKEKLEVLLTDFFLELSRKVSNINLNYQTDVKAIAYRFEQCRAEMYENPSNYDLEYYCRKLGFSPSRVSYYYNTFFHTTPVADINDAKAQFVKTCLTKDTTLDELCRILNFKDEAYVSRWFRKHFGMTLSCYKQTLFPSD